MGKPERLVGSSPVTLEPVPKQIMAEREEKSEKRIHPNPSSPDLFRGSRVSIANPLEVWVGERPEGVIRWGIAAPDHSRYDAKVGLRRRCASECDEFSGVDFALTPFQIMDRDRIVKIIADRCLPVDRPESRSDTR